jgi:hypothetical protein
VHSKASHHPSIAKDRTDGCITDEVTGKAGEGFSPRVKNLNLIGPKIRRLRHQRNWSQNDLAIRFARMISKPVIEASVGPALPMEESSSHPWDASA